jgi:hypothetical protein
MALELGSGTTTLFQQTAAPVNWTKVTTYNDYMLRVVTGAQASSGGSVDFTSVFNTKTVSLPGTPAGSIGPVAISLNQMAPHIHQYYTGDVSGPGQGTSSGQLGPKQGITGFNSGSSPAGLSQIGGGTAHTHPSGDLSFSWSQTGSLDLRIKYVDTIIATRN